MILKAIETEEQNDNALARIYDLMQMRFEEGSSELEELENLSILVEEFEKINYPLLKLNQ